MTNSKAYRTIAKHLYVAKRISANSRPVIILADDLSEAQTKAMAFFWDGEVLVSPVARTNDPQIYVI